MDDIKCYLEDTLNPPMNYIDNIYIYRIEDSGVSKYTSIVVPKDSDEDFFLKSNPISVDGQELKPLLDKDQETNSAMLKTIKKQISDGFVFESIDDAYKDANREVLRILDIIERQLEINSSLLMDVSRHKPALSLRALTNELGTKLNVDKEYIDTMSERKMSRCKKSTPICNEVNDMKEDLKFYLVKTVDPYMTYIDNIYIYRIEGELLKTIKYVAVILPAVFDKNFLVKEDHKPMWDGHEIEHSVGNFEYEGQEINRGMRHLIEEQIKKGNIYESTSEAIEKAAPRVEAMLDLIESDLTGVITLLKENYDKLEKDKDYVDNIKEGE